MKKKITPTIPQGTFRYPLLCPPKNKKYVSLLAVLTPETTKKAFIRLGFLLIVQVLGNSGITLAAHSFPLWLIDIITPQGGTAEKWLSAGWLKLLRTKASRKTPCNQLLFFRSKWSSHIFVCSYKRKLLIHSQQWCFKENTHVKTPVVIAVFRSFHDLIL